MSLSIRYPHTAQPSASIGREGAHTDHCIHWLFEEQVAASPDAVAVNDGRSARSYAELNERANRLAHHLRSKGIGPSTPVGVCMERSVDLIAALMGILKCGVAYVPMESAWPDQRIELIVSSLGLRALVIDCAQMQRLRQLRLLKPKKTAIVVLDDGDVGTMDQDGVADVPMGICWRDDLPTHNLLRRETPDDRAYIIFTSGSTGTPKAVVVRHRSVINLFNWVNKTFDIGPKDKILFATSIAFDLSVYDIFGILAAGGTIRVGSAEELQDPQRTAEILAGEQITFWDSAPAAFERLCPFLNTINVETQLRLVFLSGDWIPLSLPPAIKQKFPRARVIALGGATEATIWSNFHEIGEIDPNWRSIPYGRPIPNVCYRILDVNCDPCPVGSSGSLYIGGACLADGYANDPDLTARKFISDPFVPGQRLYVTGDRARYFPDGTIELLGRMDRQIKIRGFRVEPAEIEATLQQHSQVLRAVVMPEGEIRSVKRLVAYVALRDGHADKAITSGLRNFLALRLPQHMLPARIVILNQMPLTANGKIDLSALPHISQANLGDDQTPCTPIQRKLADIWCRILGLDKVGIYQSFIDLGGDSLQTVAMISDAAAVGVHLRMKDVVERPTIAELVALNRTPPAQRDIPCEVLGEIPLTPIQSWFFSRPLRFPQRYNAVFAFDVAAPVGFAQLRRALHQLHRHHHALMLRFAQVGGRWLQFYANPNTEPEATAWDLASLVPSAQEEEIRHRIANLRCAINLENGPLLHAILINRGKSHCQRLLLIIHHLLFDAASLSVLIEDLTTLLAHTDSSVSLRLPGSSSFAAWASRLDAYANSTDAIEDSHHWLSLPWNQIKPLPRDYPMERNTYGESRTIRGELTVEETSALHCAGPRKCHASVGEILLAGCTQVLSRWAGHHPILLDLTDHGRHELFEDISLARTVGYVTYNTPLIIAVSPETPLAKCAVAVRDRLRAMPKHGMGYGILRYLSPEAPAISILRRHPKPEVKFNYLGAMTTKGITTNLFRPVAGSFPGVLDAREPRAYLHNLELSIIDQNLRIEWKFSAAIHRPQTIQRLLDQYLSGLREWIRESAILANCTQIAGDRWGAR